MNVQPFDRLFCEHVSYHHINCYIGIQSAVFCRPPSDPDLDRILTEGQDPGAQQYIVLGTVPIKGKKPGVLGAHAFFVLGTVPIKSKDPGAQQYLVLGTVPIKRKKLGFWVPMHFLY